MFFCALRGSEYFTEFVCRLPIHTMYGKSLRPLPSYVKNRQILNSISFRTTRRFQNHFLRRNCSSSISLIFVNFFTAYSSQCPPGVATLLSTLQREPVFKISASVSPSSTQLTFSSVSTDFYNSGAAPSVTSCEEILTIDLVYQAKSDIVTLFEDNRYRGEEQTSV